MVNTDHFLPGFPVRSVENYRRRSDFLWFVKRSLINLSDTAPDDDSDYAHSVPCFLGDCKRGGGRKIFLHVFTANGGENVQQNFMHPSDRMFAGWVLHFAGFHTKIDSNETEDDTQDTLHQSLYRLRLQEIIRRRGKQRPLDRLLTALAQEFFYFLPYKLIFRA